MSFRYIFILFFAYNVTSYGQSSIGDFLRSASGDPKVKTLTEQLQYLGGKPYRISPLQKLEVRTQNHELIRGRQDYAVRLTAANPWEVRNNNQYFKAYQSALALENQMVLKDALTQRYHCVINYLHQKEIKSLIEEHQKLISDQIAMLESQSGSNYFDADEYIDLQVDQVEQSIALEEIEFELLNKINQAERLYDQPLKQEIKWNDNALISISRIKTVVDSLSSSSATSILLAYQQQKIDLARSEYKLEKANINAGFIQTQYDQRRIEQGRNPINISLGVTIPITNPNKGDMAKRQLDVIEATHDLEDSKKGESADNEILNEKIIRLTQRHLKLSENLKELQNSSLAGTLSTLKNGDPRFILRFYSSQAKLKVILSKLRRDILIAYIDYLNISDKLQQQPFINYLSPNLEKM